jgi:hypothetical protein
MPLFTPDPFTNAIDGQTISFPVDFDKENGAWKISLF